MAKGIWKGHEITETKRGLLARKKRRCQPKGIRKLAGSLFSSSNSSSNHQFYVSVIQDY
jgi:hypothetical protein